AAERRSTGLITLPSGAGRDGSASAEREPPERHRQDGVHHGYGNERRRSVAVDRAVQKDERADHEVHETAERQRPRIDAADRLVLPGPVRDRKREVHGPEELDRNAGSGYRRIERGGKLVRCEQGGQAANGQDPAAAYHQDLRVHRTASISSRTAVIFFESLMKFQYPAAREPSESPPDSRRAIFGAFAADELVGLGGFQRQGGRKLEHKAFIWGMYVISRA